MSESDDHKSQLSVCPTIQQALEFIHDVKDNNDLAQVNVLFTGSLHLIGSTLGVLNSMNEMKLKTSKKAKRLRSV